METERQCDSCPSHERNIINERHSMWNTEILDAKERAERGHIMNN